MVPVFFVFFLGAGIAYANGANDVSKGIATLVGSGSADYRRAIAWGTLWTGVGGLSGALLGKAMVATFGKGIFAAGVQPTLATAIAILFGAMLWVGIATHKGLPVSTTHAIVGSIVGVAVLAFGPAGMNWATLTHRVVLPLVLSPMIALLLTAATLRTLNAVVPATDCVCLEVSRPALASDALLAPDMALVQVAACVSKEQPNSRGITFNHLHWGTSAATSFSRGLNDAPKIVALVLGAMLVAGTRPSKPLGAFVVVTAGMLAGGWLAGRKVTRVLGCKVTPMNHRESFIANLITVALVAPGTALGLPMSTTHVASGAIIGISSGEHKLNHSVVREMILAWVVTVPGAALLGAAVLVVLRAMGMK